jgi:chromosome partitioning protein
MAKIITVANGKGGVGKTDTAKNLSYCLAQKGYMVLMVDQDPQGNGSRVMSGGLYKFKDGDMTDIYATKGVEVIDVMIQAKDGKTGQYIDNLYVAPVMPSFGDAVTAAHQRTRREQILEKALKSVLEDFDFIIIDCAPALDLSALNAINVSDLIVSPIGDVVSVESTGPLYQKIEDLRDGDMPLTYIFRTMKDSRVTIVNAEISKDMEGCFIPNFKTEVNMSSDVSKSVIANQAVCAYKKGSIVSMKYRDLTNEILEVLK